MTKDDPDTPFLNADLFADLAPEPFDRFADGGEHDLRADQKLHLAQARHEEYAGGGYLAAGGQVGAADHLLLDQINEDLAAPWPGDEVTMRYDGDSLGGSGSLLAQEVVFASGSVLPLAAGAEGYGEAYYDPSDSGNPLLDTGGTYRKVKLSKNFSVDELARSGETPFNKARIDPALVTSLQALRDFLQKPIDVIDGYYSYKFLQDLAKRRGVAVKDANPHLSGQGAKFRVRGLPALEVAKAVVIACPNDTSISTGSESVAVYVRRSTATVTSYIKNGAQRDNAIETIRRYRDLFYKAPSDVLIDLERYGLEHARGFVHWAIQNLSIRDEELLTEIVFYKSGYVVSQRFDLDERGRYDAKRSLDRNLWQEILTKVVRPMLQDRLSTAVQSGADPHAVKGERVLAPPMSDNPRVDITGRYEVEHSDKSAELGKVLVINQAGSHIEAVMSNVLSPKNRQRQDRFVHLLHGDIQGDGSFTLQSRTTEYLKFTLVPHGSSLKLMRTVDGREVEEAFSRVSSAPTLSDQALSTLGESSELARRQQWYPLLQSQVDHLLAILGDAKKVEQLLRMFFFIDGDSSQHTKEFHQGKAAEVFIEVLSNLFDDPAHGIHESDWILARFYCRFILSLNRWRPTSNHPQLSHLDWLYRMAMIVNHNSIKTPNGNWIMDGLKSHLGVDIDSNGRNEPHVYRINLEFSGASLGVGGYQGEITIEKIDEQKWPEGKVTFGIWFAVVSVGGGIKVNESFEGTFSSSIYWQPRDFPGSVRMAIGGLSVATGSIEGAVQGGFLQIFGRDGLPMRDIIFTSHGLKPTDQVKFKAGIELTEAMGKIQDKNLPININYPSTKVETNYAVTYDLEEDVYLGFNSALLTPAARQAIRVMGAHELAAFSSPLSALRIIGHADRKGTDKANLTLTALRAANALQAVEDILGSSLRIPKQRIRVEGKGETEAREAGDKDDVRNLDRRRVDIILNGRRVLVLKSK